MKKPKVGFIGLGGMGTGMCKKLLEAGHPVTVFNRTSSKAESIRQLGAEIKDTPRQVAENVEILITMVSDDKALKDVVFGDDGALKGLQPESIHISMSTISESLAETLSNEHLKTKTHHIGAPVFGRPPAAAAGKLYIIAGGTEAAIERCRDIFTNLGQKLVVVGTEPKNAHLTKILGNFMLFSAIETMAEAIAHAKTSGLDERIFLEAMTSTIFNSPLYSNYGTMMVDKNFPTSGAVSFQLALKDVSLVLQSSATQNTTLPVAEFLRGRLKHGIETGYENYDVSALVELAAGLHKTERV